MELEWRIPSPPFGPRPQKPKTILDQLKEMELEKDLEVERYNREIETAEREIQKTTALLSAAIKEHGAIMAAIAAYEAVQKEEKK